MGIVVGFGYKTFNGFKLDGIAGEGLVFVRNPRFFKKAGFRQNKKGSDENGDRLHDTNKMIATIVLVI